MKTIGELIDAGVISRETKVLGDKPWLTDDGHIICKKSTVWVVAKDFWGDDNEEYKVYAATMTSDPEDSEPYWGVETGPGGCERVFISGVYSTQEAAQAALAAKETK